MRYRTIIADPGWQYQQTFSSTGSSLTPRSAEENYTVKSIDDICRLGAPPNFTLSGHVHPYLTIAGHGIEDDAFLFLWITNPLLVTDAAHLQVCKAWGFKPKQLITWIKGRLDETVDKKTGQILPKLVLRTGLGHYTRGVTEHMVLATRGQPKVFVKDAGVNNLILEDEDTVILESPRGHSRKPETSYQLVERLCPGPYLELFAREQRTGWTCWGDQL